MDHWLEHLHQCMVLGGRNGKDSPYSASICGLTNRGDKFNGAAGLQMCA